MTASVSSRTILYAEFGVDLLSQQIKQFKTAIVEGRWQPLANALHQYNTETYSAILYNLTQYEFTQLLLGIRTLPHSEAAYVAFNILLSREDQMKSLTPLESNMMTGTRKETLFCEADEERMAERIVFFLNKYSSKVSVDRLQALLVKPEIQKDEWAVNMIRQNIRAQEEATELKRQQS